MRTGDMGDALKSESLTGRKTSPMVRNVWVKAFA